MQRRQTRQVLFDLGHVPGKGIPQPLDHLEQGKVGIGRARAGEIALVAENIIELAEKFRHTVFEETACSGTGFGLLVLIIETGAEGMMGVMNFPDQIGKGEL